MLILTLRTDKPEAEIGLFDDDTQLDYQTWYAHRELSITLHRRITDMLAAHQKQLADLQGIAVFKGPGSFTGLRIGLTVANTIAYGLDIPVVSTQGDDWLTQARAQLTNGANEKIALPFYGAEANITVQKR